MDSDSSEDDEEESESEEESDDSELESDELELLLELLDSSSWISFSENRLLELLLLTSWDSFSIFSLLICFSLYLECFKVGFSSSVSSPDSCFVSNPGISSLFLWKE